MKLQEIKYYYVLFLFLVLNGERVGGCPSSINSSSSLTGNECQVDTDCSTNDLHKCCPNGLGLKECVNPTPGKLSVQGYVVSSAEYPNEDHHK